MKSLTFFFIIAAFLLGIVACKEPKFFSQHKNYDPVPYNESIVILQKTDSISKDYAFVGSVNLDNTNNHSLCSEAAIEHFLKTELKKYGANVIHIQEYQPPQTKYHCLKMSANLYRSLNNKEQQRFIPDTISNKTNSYLFLYRPAYNVYQTIPFEILINNKSVGTIKNNSILIIPVNTSGIIDLTAKIITHSTIPILIESGYSYYIKCSIGIGSSAHNPCIQVMQNNKGSIEYKKIAQQ